MIKFKKCKKGERHNSHKSWRQREVRSTESQRVVKENVKEEKRRRNIFEEHKGLKKEDRRRRKRENKEGTGTVFRETGEENAKKIKVKIMARR